MPRKKKPLVVEDTIPIYIRVSPEAQAFIEDEAWRTGHYKGHILTAIIDSVRLKKKYHVEPRVMRTLEKVKRQHEKRLKKYRK